MKKVYIKPELGNAHQVKFESAYTGGSVSSHIIKNCFTNPEVGRKYDGGRDGGHHRGHDGGHHRGHGGGRH